MGKTIKNPLFWIVIIFFILSGIYLFNLDKDDPFIEREDVAVEVNDVKFSFSDFDRVASQIKQEYMTQGVELSEKELEEIVVERLVQQALLMELADERGVEVSSEELEDYFQEIMAMYEMDDEDEFLGQLKEEGLGSRAEVNEILTSEIRVNKLLELFTEEVDVTQEEVEEAYDRFVQQVRDLEGVEDIPSFEELEEEIIQSLTQEEVTAIILAKLEEMKENAVIKTYLEEVKTEETRSEVEMIDPEELELEGDKSSDGKKEELISDKTNDYMNYIITLETNRGEIEFKTYADEAPNTVENFITLAKKGFYDGLTFHRVIDGFMIQGGCPEGTGTGGPGYTFEDEIDPSAEIYQNGYSKGIVAMANAGPNTQGSQFFIMVADYNLPSAYTIFGEVVSGQEVADEISLVEKDSRDKPLEDVIINKVLIKGVRE